MPSDVSTLLRDILDAPAADEPRLAYADILARSPREVDRARAQFIRGQIELDGLSEDDSRWAVLVGQTRDLLERHRAAWEKPLRDLFRPSLATPIRWLRSRFFPNGGRWGFHRGFVEHILASAPSFLDEDTVILDHAPIRRVVLTHASNQIAKLAADDRLQRLASLHLIGDMELDEELNALAACAREAGFTVLEFRIPRLSEDLNELSETLRASHGSPHLATFAAWRQADADGQRRLHELALSRRLDQFARDPADEGERLAQNEWVYLGDRISSAGVWAVAKGHQDLEDDDSRCRRLLLIRPGHGDDLRDSPYCVGEI